MHHVVVWSTVKESERERGHGGTEFHWCHWRSSDCNFLRWPIGAELSWCVEDHLGGWMMPRSSVRSCKTSILACIQTKSRLVWDRSWPPARVHLVTLGVLNVGQIWPAKLNSATFSCSISWAPVGAWLSALISPLSPSSGRTLLGFIPWRRSCWRIWGDDGALVGLVQVEGNFCACFLSLVSNMPSVISSSPHSTPVEALSMR
jgi:hypothetical protein